MWYKKGRCQKGTTYSIVELKCEMNLHKETCPAKEKKKIRTSASSLV